MISSLVVFGLWPLSVPKLVSIVACNLSLNLLQSEESFVYYLVLVCQEVWSVSMFV